MRVSRDTEDEMKDWDELLFVLLGQEIYKEFDYFIRFLQHRVLKVRSHLCRIFLSRLMWMILVSRKFRLLSTWRWRAEMEDAHGNQISMWSLFFSRIPSSLQRPENHLLKPQEFDRQGYLFLIERSKQRYFRGSFSIVNLLFQIKLSVRQRLANIIANIEKIRISFERSVLLKQVANKYAIIRRKVPDVQCWSISS